MEQLLTDQGIAVDQKYLDGVLDAYDLDQSGEIDLGVLPCVATKHSLACKHAPSADCAMQRPR